MMNSRHLPAGQGIPMDSGRRRTYNQNQYQNPQYPQQPVYRTYIQPYSASYYPQSMQPQYHNSQAPVPSYTQYQSYVRSPPVQHYVASPFLQQQVPYIRPTQSSATSSLHQALPPHPQTPLSSRSSQSSSTIPTSLVSSTSKRNSSKNSGEPVHFPCPDLTSKPSFRAPLPWFSRPDLNWPEKRTSKKRKPVQFNSTGAVNFPTISRNGNTKDSSAKKAAENLTQTLETSTGQGTKDIPADLITPSSKQPPKVPITITSVVKPTPKQTNRTIPIVPALPRTIHRQALNPSLIKEDEKKQVCQKESPGKTLTTETEKTQEKSIEAIKDSESASPAVAWKTPKLWAGIFQPSSVTSTATSREAIPTTNFSEFQATSHNSLPEVLRSFNTDSSESKVTFLEPRGLVNTGNMCYMNSILQVLIFCTFFFDFLDQVSKRAACSFKSVTPLLDAMVLFMREYSVIDIGTSADQLRTRLKEGDLEQYGESFIPDFFYNVINRLPRFSSMRRGHQQDAEEFLGFLLEGLHDECVQAIRSTLEEEGIKNSSKNIPSQSNTESDQFFSSADCTGWLEVGPKQKASVTRSSGFITAETPVTRIFGGNLRSELRVPGLKDSVTMEPFQSLMLDIGATHVNNIIDALKGLTCPEPLHDDFKSPKGPNVKATKQVFIETLPPVLILHLKRFQYDNTGGTQKVWKKIGYPLELELPKEVFSRQKRITFSNNGLPKYRLISAVYHHGKNASGGHYTVDVRRQDGREWIRLDDTVIRRVRSEDVAQGGSEEDIEVVNSKLDPQKKGIFAPNTALDSAKQAVQQDGWKQASGTGKKLPNINGNSACKLSSENSSLKDNKVAYLLFYQKI